MLNVGDRIFIPNYGAGVVLDIEKKGFFGEEKEYIIIYLIVDDMDLMIPMEKYEEYRIRSVVGKEELEETLSILKEGPSKIESNWSKRYRKNKAKLASGNINQMCEVVRDLNYLRKSEILPQGEEKILEKAEHLVASEIMLLYGISVDKAYEKIRNLIE